MNPAGILGRGIRSAYSLDMRVLLKLTLDCTPDAAWRALRSPAVLREVVATSQTVAFADSAQVKCLNWPTCDSVSLEEVWLIEPPKNEYPTVHFRHAGTAQVAFLDGHVESYIPSWIDHASLPVEQAKKIRELGLAHLGPDESLYDPQ